MKKVISSIAILAFVTCMVIAYNQMSLAKDRKAVYQSYISRYSVTETEKLIGALERLAKKQESGGFDGATHYTYPKNGEAHCTFSVNYLLLFTSEGTICVHSPNSFFGDFSNTDHVALSLHPNGHISDIEQVPLSIPVSQSKELQEAINAANMMSNVYANTPTPN